MAPVFAFAKYALFLVLAVFLSTLVHQSSGVPLQSGRPPRPGSSIFKLSSDCKNDNELLDLCQRCAKLTKSKAAYPACCSDDITARRWCSDFVYFGSGPDPHRNF